MACDLQPMKRTFCMLKNLVFEMQGSNLQDLLPAGQSQANPTRIAAQQKPELESQLRQRPGLPFLLFQGSFSSYSPPFLSDYVIKKFNLFSSLIG